ncbi:MAG: serine hydrolase, partial [Pseudomonadales bacterium]|nr:serine hydrolase [Pseudomonadales bacterium]
AYFNTGGFKADSPASYQAEFGAGGGLTNGLGLAKMYAPLANEGWWRGQQLISQQQISWMSETAVRGGEDRTLIMPTHFTLGFMKTMDNRYRAGGALESLRLGSHAFGHAGAGGSVGFADPELGISMGYVMNQMGPGILLNERSQRLVDATYACLGFDETVFGDFRKPRS